MQYSPDLVLLENISEGIINNPVFYTESNGLSGIGQIKLTPNSSGLVKAKFLTPSNMSDLCLIGHGSSLDGDTCRLGVEAIEEQSAILFEAVCSGTGEQIFTFSFSGVSA